MSRGGPPDDAHLAIRLTRIGQQVEERIDEAERRRRRGWRVVVGVSLTVGLGASALTAAALSYAPPATVVVEVPVSVERLRCIAGADADLPAYFTVRYAVPAAAPDPVDPILACQGASELRSRITDDLTPHELLVEAGRLLAEAAGDADGPTVQHAAFGPLPAAPAASAVWSSCSAGSGSGGGRVVFAHAPGADPDCGARG